MIGWLDCAAGASGDMFLGALVDAGAPLPAIQGAIAALGTEPIQLEVSTVERHGIGATKVDVRVPRSNLTRTWGHIRRQLERADLVEPVRRTALAAFARLARAEAAVHRITMEQVRFHEVGALDAIADVLGTAAGLHALGVTTLTASTVTLGTGMVRGEHGLLPVPGPAVLELLREAGAPVWAGPAPYEMCTPTGAALLAATVTGWGTLPPMTVRRVGVGAGSRALAELPNILRLVVGEPAEGRPTGRAVLLESNVDDLDPRLWPDVLERLLAAGAADAWLTPILMKKGRPAYALHALCPVSGAATVRAEIFRRTSTIGLRESTVDKHALERGQGHVEVLGHRIGVKLAQLDGETVNVSVEFEDVRRAAEVLGLPVKEVLRSATAAAHSAYPDSC
ncbi:MAG TPA: nickel pincer cofactor biosynthesis protein LarC [Mycobacteriales bacterium]|nr:nickel pincer cofactor biosynthesis protein LarC [Mycobacteriales bacterium]